MCSSNNGGRPRTSSPSLDLAPSSCQLMFESRQSRHPFHLAQLVLPGMIEKGRGLDPQYLFRRGASPDVPTRSRSTRWRPRSTGMTKAALDALLHGSRFRKCSGQPTWPCERPLAQSRRGRTAGHACSSHLVRTEDPNQVVESGPQVMARSPPWPSASVFAHDTPHRRRLPTLKTC